MNHVADNARLFRLLTLTDVTVVSRLVALVILSFAAASADGFGLAGMGWSAAVTALLAPLAPTWERYRAIGLDTRYWRHHHRLLVSATVIVLLLLAVVMWSLTPIHIQPVFLLGLVVGGGIALLRKDGAHQHRGQAMPERSRFPLTPVVQMIREPQVTAWAFLWGGAPVLVIVLGLLVQYARLESDLAGIFFTVVFVQGVFVIMGEFGRSFREWVGFGGHRAVWARETAVIGFISPVCALVLGVLAALVSGQLLTTEMVVVPVAGALLLAIVVVLAELASGRTWWVPIAYVGAGVGVVVLWATGHLPVGMVLASGIVLYLLHALTLPAVARQAVPGSSGASAWLGLRKRATA